MSLIKWFATAIEAIRPQCDRAAGRNPTDRDWIAGMRRLRGIIDLTFDLVEETINLVERTHDALVERSTRRFAFNKAVKSTAKVVTGIQTAISGGVFESIRVINGITRLTVNAAADVAEAGLDQIS